MSTTPSRPLDARIFAIGVLGITACVLFVGLILISQQPAYAIGMNDRGGDYIMLTQQLSTTTEGIVVVDAAAKQVIIYNFDYNNKALEILRRIYLDQLPKPRATEAEQTAPARRR
jgi:5-bromo-4-chloroindolyl phosphate hydrolysis protein